MVDAAVSKMMGNDTSNRGVNTDMTLGMTLFVSCLVMFSAASVFYNVQISSMACVLFVVVWGLVGWANMGFVNSGASTVDQSEKRAK